MHPDFATSAEDKRKDWTAIMTGARRKVARLRTQLRGAEEHLHELENGLHDEVYPPMLVDVPDEGTFKLALHDGFGFYRNATPDECKAAYPQEGLTNS